MRNATACKQCRQTKRRCIKTDDRKVTCDNCNERRQPCSLNSHVHRNDQHTRPWGKPQLLPTNGDDEMLAQIPKAQKMALVNDYFALIHDRPHSLFHRTTFLNDLEANRIDKTLVLSMCALSSYLSTEESVRRYGPGMAHLSKALLLANIGTPEISHVQTAILLANVFAAERDPQAEAMFFAIANRMAQILRLHEVDDNDEPVMQQVKCRIWWTLVMADYWSSAGLMIQRQLEYQRCNLPLPGPEDLFQDASPHQSVLEMSSPGLWAHMIDLVRIFGRIQDLHQSLVMETSSNADLDLQVENLARQLEGWTSMLPPDKILNEENLQHHIDRGLGGPYVALHLGFHHYFTLLFFHSLDSSQPYTPSEPAFIHRCRAHALSFSRLLLTSRETRGCEANYATVGHMTVVSSSVLLHMLLFGNDSELVEAKAALMGNFAVLTELNKYWPSVGVAMRRLLIFQDACRQSNNECIHRIDQWMFRFLYQHSRCLDRPTSQTRGEVTEEREAILMEALHPLRV